MEVEFSKTNNFDFNHYDIYLNSRKYSLENKTKIDIEETENHFYIKTFFIKSQEYQLEPNHKKCFIEVDHFINKKRFLVFIATLITLVTLYFIFETNFLWYLIISFGILIALFQLYIHTIGMKHYIKVKIEYQD